MSRAETISLRGGLGVVAEELARLRVKDFTPVMQQIQAKYMEPLKEASWMGSGLHSRSGQLYGAVRTFAGKTSVGIGINSPSYRSLVMAKAITHTFGRKKWSSKRAVYRSGWRKSKKTGQLKWSNKILSSKKLIMVKSPWGDIPARPFIPETLPPSVTAEVQNMVVEYINDRLGRTR